MDLPEMLELTNAYVQDIPPVNRMDMYVQGVFRMLRTSLSIQSQAILNREAIAEQGPEFFKGVEASFFDEMTEYVMRRMNWNLETHGDLPERKEGDRWVFLMNHPTLLATWPPLNFTSQHFAPNTAVIGKSEVLKNPLVAMLMGNALRDLGKLGPIERGKREEAILGVKTAVEQVLHPNTGLVLFPDGHRPYPSRLFKERRDWSKKLPDAHVKDWMTETCFPRSGGLYALLQATEDRPEIRFANFTVAEPLEEGGTFHIAFEELQRGDMLGQVSSRENLEKWLFEEWKRKNSQIREWRY